jgi:predicted site-specific integrase-resolvase
MSVERKTTERRTHPYGRAQFEVQRDDLERRLRRIYGRDWPQGFDDVIARIARARVRENFGLSPRG